MNERDLIDSISEIDEEFLERSEKNKENAAAQTETPITGKAVKRRFWKLPAIIAAAVLLVLCVSGLLVFIINGGKGKNNISVSYLVSAAEYPKIMKAPVTQDYDEGGDGLMGTQEWEAYFADEKEWLKQKTELINVYGYDPTRGKTGLLDFNAKMMPIVLEERNHENVVYSPLNIYIALGMLAEASDGNTRQQVLDLLGIESLDALRSQMKGLWNSAFSNDNSKCLLASSVWLSDDISYNKETLDDLAEHYYSSSFSSDMSSADYTKTFRNWLNEQTDGILEQQIEGLSFSPETVMALATTVSFSARWQNEFLKEFTESGMFHAAGGDVPCEFMRRTSDDMYFWGDRFGAVQKWFDGHNGMMQFILPDEGVSVYELLEDEQVLDFIDKGLQYEQSKNVIVNMSIPKFDISSNSEITEALKKLGITDAFEADKADFSPVSSDTSNISISRVEHGVRVITDEDGVKAAAYTVELMTGAGLPPEEKIDFVLDRPFMFVIRLGDGLPLFVGIVENP